MKLFKLLSVIFICSYAASTFAAEGEEDKPSGARRLAGAYAPAVREQRTILQQFKAYPLSRPIQEWVDIGNRFRRHSDPMVAAQHASLLRYISRLERVPLKPRVYAAIGAGRYHEQKKETVIAKKHYEYAYVLDRTDLTARVRYACSLDYNTEALEILRGVISETYTESWQDILKVEALINLSNRKGVSKEEKERSLRMALKMAKDYNNRSLEAKALMGLGGLATEGKKELFDKALILSRDAGDKETEVTALISLGRILPEYTLQLFNEALEKAAAIGNVRLQVNALLGLAGNDHLENSKRLRYYSNAIEIASRTENDGYVVWLKNKKAKFEDKIKDQVEKTRALEKLSHRKSEVNETIKGLDARLLEIEKSIKEHQGKIKLLELSIGQIKAELRELDDEEEITHNKLRKTGVLIGRATIKVEELRKKEEDPEPMIISSRRDLLAANKKFKQADADLKNALKYQKSQQTALTNRSKELVGLIEERSKKEIELRETEELRAAEMISRDSKKSEYAEVKVEKQAAFIVFKDLEEKYQKEIGIAGEKRGREDPDDEGPAPRRKAP